MVNHKVYLLLTDSVSSFSEWLHTSCSLSTEHFTLIVAVVRVKAGPDCSLFPHCSNPHSGLVLCACLCVVWGDHGYRVENKGSQDEDNYLNNNTLIHTQRWPYSNTHLAQSSTFSVYPMRASGHGTSQWVHQESVCLNESAEWKIQTTRNLPDV